MSYKPVLISYPCGNMVHADFAMSLSYLLMQSMMDGIEVGIAQTRGSVIDASRNMMVEQALVSKADFGYMLMLDSDMTFPRDILKKLLARKREIVGVSYCMRMSPRSMTHRDLAETSKLPEVGRYPKDIYEVRSLGMGCVLISMDVFTSMIRKYPGEPLFKIEYRSMTHHVSEDIYFFNLCRKLGYKVYCDIEQSYRVGHVGDYRYTHLDVQRTISGPNTILEDTNDAA